MRNVIYFLGQLLFLPHLFLFLFSPNRSLVIMDLYAGKKVNSSLYSQLYDLSRALLTNSYFRTLFYFRTQGLFSKMLRIFYPKNKTFIIDVNSSIGGGLRLAHPYATILHAEKIGEHVYVNHLVTVGEKNGKRPIIGHHVAIHANATIIGGITIGDYAVIGAGAVVVKDVPNHATVAGNPAKIIHPHV